MATAVSKTWKRPPQVKKPVRSARRIAKAAASAAPKPDGLVNGLIDVFGDQQTLARVSGFSLRALAYYKNGTRPVRGAAERRLVELDRLGRALGTIMVPSAVKDWLHRPNNVFSNLKPIEVIERGNIDQIWRLIHLADSGTVS